ncbi:hypothetical protein NL676_034941 [Syzygium grande]|nr:hypothetical protein NL676_034941 [Syzygium grande]
MGTCNIVATLSTRRFVSSESENHNYLVFHSMPTYDTGSYSTPTTTFVGLGNELEIKVPPKNREARRGKNFAPPQSATTAEMLLHRNFESEARRRECGGRDCEETLGERRRCTGQKRRGKEAEEERWGLLLGGELV